MELFLLRHGNAETQAVRDFDRSLSQLGKAELKSVFNHVGPHLGALQGVYVSPYLRAQQTYEEVAPYLGFSSKEDCKMLVPGGNPYGVVDFVYRLALEKHKSSLMLISHQPLLGTLLNLFCGFEPGSHHMGTSSLAAIDMDIPGVSMGQMRWLKYPQL